MTKQFYIPGSMVRDARALALRAHSESNHHYGDLPYAAHLSDVAGLAISFIDLIEDPELRDVAVASAWLHDAIEDARLSYNDIKKVVGRDVVEVVFYVTTNKGRTRDERADASYYQGIKDRDLALFVKLCDRLANALNANDDATAVMLNVYRTEYSHFEAELRDGRFAPIWIALDWLIGT